MLSDTNCIGQISIHLLTAIFLCHHLTSKQYYLIITTHIKKKYSTFLYNFVFRLVQLKT